jgi:hypothetical protein
VEAQLFLRQRTVLKEEMVQLHNSDQSLSLVAAAAARMAQMGLDELADLVVEVLSLQTVVLDLSVKEIMVALVLGAITNPTGQAAAVVVQVDLVRRAQIPVQLRDKQINLLAMQAADLVVPVSVIQ